MLEQVELRVKSIVAEQLSVDLDKINNSDSFTDSLGADSLDTVALLIALEEALEIEIPDAEASKIKNVQDAINFAQDILAKKSNIEHNQKI